MQKNIRPNNLVNDLLWFYAHFDEPIKILQRIGLFTKDLNQLKSI